ncbi:hypothetical protein CYMTET_23766 [Cymbomonas tetramitiformis]|uniref:Uncharacterized protein n=1 Tax=Cymbomonas tetramitiformis TaxID=36881 RepID=A0AAE0FXU9_9CHLO|nr:hypothetical protein CYMTET_23766 [Cymbomonas tetramitiformis]
MEYGSYKSLESNTDASARQEGRHRRATFTAVAIALILLASVSLYTLLQQDDSVYGQAAPEMPRGQRDVQMSGGKKSGRSIWVEERAGDARTPSTPVSRAGGALS